MKQYLVLTDDNDNRKESKSTVNMASSEIQKHISNGYYLISEEDFNKLIGNTDKLYKISHIDGTIYEVDPPEPTLDELKTAKLAEVDMWTANKIVGGFVSSCSGEEVTYDSDKDTQLTMQGIALNVNSELFAEKYPTGCPVRGYPKGIQVKQIYMLTPEQVLLWQADLSIHIGTCKQDGWAKQAEVEKAVSKEELDAIVLE